MSKQHVDIEILSASEDAIIDFWFAAAQMLRRDGQKYYTQIGESLRDRFSRAMYRSPDLAEILALSFLRDYRQKIDLLRMAMIALASEVAPEDLLAFYQELFPGQRFPEKWLSASTPPSLANLSELTENPLDIIQNTLPLLTMVKKEGILSIEPLLVEMPDYARLGFQNVLDGLYPEMIDSIMKRKAETLSGIMERKLRMTALAIRRIHEGINPRILQDELLAFFPEYPEQDY